MMVFASFLRILGGEIQPHSISWKAAIRYDDQASYIFIKLPGLAKARRILRNRDIEEQITQAKLTLIRIRARRDGIILRRRHSCWDWSSDASFRPNDPSGYAPTGILARPGF